MAHRNTICLRTRKLKGVLNLAESPQRIWRAFVGLTYRLLGFVGSRWYCYILVSKESMEKNTRRKTLVDQKICYIIASRNKPNWPRKKKFFFTSTRWEYDDQLTGNSKRILLGIQCIYNSFSNHDSWIILLFDDFFF